MVIATSEEKLRELIIYIAKKCESDTRFGLTKLAKIILFSDMLYYANFGSSITGQTYTKEKRGPLAKDFYKVKDDLLAKKEVVELKRPVITHELTQVVATREPNYKLFTPEEVSFVDTIIKELENHNGTKASKLSHMYFVAWQDLNYNEEIPYQTIFLPTNYELTDSDKNYSVQLMKQYGWDKTYGWITG